MLSLGVTVDAADPSPTGTGSDTAAAPCAAAEFGVAAGVASAAPGAGTEDPAFAWTGAATGPPSSRRAAASITHDTGDCTGESVPVPSNGASTDSTAPLAAAVCAGAAAITGAAASGDAESANPTTDALVVDCGTTKTGPTTAVSTGGAAKATRSSATDGWGAITVSVDAIGLACCERSLAEG